MTYPHNPQVIRKIRLVVWRILLYDLSMAILTSIVIYISKTVKSAVFYFAM